MTNRYFQFLALAILLFSSCTPAKNVAYFNNLQDSIYRSTVTVTESPFQKNDIISITVSSLNEEASAIFNSKNLNVAKNTTVTGSNTESNGYLINNEGNIQLPIIGNIKAEGLTKTQLKAVITKAINDKKLLVDPIVDIRHLNFEVTVLGEVAHPTVITVPSEKISLVKALGLAGDLTIYGKRTNVLLIREEAGVRKTARINLNSSDLITSPYYYLRPNDVVYVEPNKAKIVSSSTSQQIAPIVLSSLSIIVIVLVRIF